METSQRQGRFSLLPLGPALSRRWVREGAAHNLSCFLCRFGVC